MNKRANISTHNHWISVLFFLFVDGLFFCLVFIILKVFAMKNYLYERYFSNLHLHYWCFQTNVSTWKLTKGYSNLKKELFSFCQEERHGTFLALKVFFFKHPLCLMYEPWGPVLFCFQAHYFSVPLYCLSN